jgi:hypothetical protein
MSSSGITRGALASHIRRIMKVDLSEVRPNIRAALAIVAGLISGCADNKGIRTVGFNIYTASEDFAAGGGGFLTVEQTVLAEANIFCIQQGRVFLAVDMLTPARANPPDQTGYSITFRCVPPGDLALSRARGGGSDAIIDSLRDYVLPDCDSESPCR